MPELSAQQTNYYQGLIGILRWVVELGRIDIIMPVSFLSCYLVSPQEGHLQQAYQIFACLKQFNRPALVFDDSEPKISTDNFHCCDWSSQYPGATEKVPPDAPEALGHLVVTTCYVDADHAGCQVTCRSHTRVLMYVNCAPIVWYSKRQNTVESLTFSSEFIALKIAVELIESLRYKLHMFRIPIDNSTIVFCDNEAVVQNVTRPESTQKKCLNCISLMLLETGSRLRSHWFYQRDGKLGRYAYQGASRPLFAQVNGIHFSLEAIT